MFVNIWLDSVLIVILVTLILLSILLIRRKLFKLWHKASRLEVAFYNSLKACMHHYLRYEKTLSPYDPGGQLARLRNFENKNLRSLPLETRQALHRSIQTLFVSLDETEISGYLSFKEVFDAVQNKRLKYNSAVLSYNHVVQGFPIRFLANRFGFETKEYFG
ncbi:MAG: LemA family protein [Bacillota bacterium]